MSSIDKHVLGLNSAQTLPQDKPGPVTTEQEKAKGGRQQGSLRKKHSSLCHQSAGSEALLRTRVGTRRARVLSRSYYEAGKMEGNKARARAREEREKKQKLLEDEVFPKTCYKTPSAPPQSGKRDSEERSRAGSQIWVHKRCVKPQSNVAQSSDSSC